MSQPKPIASMRRETSNDAYDVLYDVQQLAALVHVATAALMLSQGDQTPALAGLWRVTAQLKQELAELKQHMDRLLG